MKKKNHRRQSNYIYILRKKDDERYYGSGTKLPKKPSIFDSSSEFNQALRNNGD